MTDQHQPPTVHDNDDNSNNQHSAPFEGPEKLLEIWFAPSALDVPDANTSIDGRFGLRKVDRTVWEEMLNIVQCKVLSMVQGEEMDAYLLSESSLFVFPHRLILKTCGTTLNLLGLPRILEIAADHANLPTVYRCFYSRKSFMFPERQLGPHRDWKQEVQFLDNIFRKGAAYTVGKVNGDHWLLYITGPESVDSPRPPDAIISTGVDINTDTTAAAATARDPEDDTPPDYTIEILMSDLSKNARDAFFTSATTDSTEPLDPSAHALTLSEKLGILSIFPPHLTTLDAYSFTPCGYSSNALIKWGHAQGQTDNGDEEADASAQGGEGYYTIHVTPEEGWSYASFECNVPLHVTSPGTPAANSGDVMPDLETLVRRVVDIFQPGRLSLTLFISSKDNESSENEQGENAIEMAQRAFRTALTGKRKGVRVYRKTDKINYEFEGYDLAFASFELVTAE
ncbi:hypothetical protein AX16_006984 [Volvariella volvacea WC 439]|nr:hypothetical protein AX16_006984 [Volvariella volvacea WC 439]